MDSGEREEGAENAAVDRAAPPSGGERAGSGGALAEVPHQGAEYGANEYWSNEAEEFHGGADGGLG